jgi:D-alanine-D-alanine ligase
MKKNLTVAVLAGGNSAERSVSLKTGAGVVAACKKLGYRVLLFDPAKDLGKLVAAKKKIDVVFPALHGRGGEDGQIQGLLELLGLNYVGSDLRGMVLSFDKVLSKDIYKKNGLPVARDLVLEKKAKISMEAVEQQVGFPCFVKPSNEGSSYGTSIVRIPLEFEPALRKAWKYGPALIEEYLQGMEISVGVLEKNGKAQVLPVAEICPKTEFFDFKAKYSPKYCEEIVPARISEALTKQAQDFALRAHQALQMRHISRTDMIIMKNKIYLLETNALPGFTPASIYPKEAAAVGISFESLVELLVREAVS